VFTSWALLSNPGSDGSRIVDFGFNWEMNSMLIGVFGHYVLFGTGYAASMLLGGYRPDNFRRLTVYELKNVDSPGVPPPSVH
jgi:SSS family solute:Na+ symporter